MSGVSLNLGTTTLPVSSSGDKPDLVSKLTGTRIYKEEPVMEWNEADILEWCKEHPEMLNPDVLNAQSGRYGTALHLVARYGHSQVARILLAFGAKVLPNEYQHSSQETPLHLAARKGHVGVVKVLLASEAAEEFIDLQDESGWTALHSAAHSGYPQVVKALLAAGANPDLSSDLGWTALSIAQSGGEGIPDGCAFAGAGATPLGWGRGPRPGDHQKVVAVFQDARIDGTKQAGKVLNWAAAKGFVEIVKQRLAAGDNPCGTYDHDTPLLSAAFGGNVEVIQLLLDAGARATLNQVNVDQKSGLHYAAEKGHLEAVRILLDAGADPTLRGHFTKTAEILAHREGHTEVVELLASAKQEAEAKWAEEGGRERRLQHFAQTGNLCAIATLALKAEKAEKSQETDGWKALQEAAVDAGLAQNIQAAKDTLRKQIEKA